MNPAADLALLDPETATARSPARPADPVQANPYDRLVREGYRFDFFQAILLMEKLFPEAPAPGETSSAREERIHLRPDPSLIFPPSDVRSVSIKSGSYPHAVITATFMGLYGVDSPLPEVVRERVALESDESRPLRDFLDIFNHRIYSYFYRAWKKYRPEVGRPAASGRERANRFLTLAGLGTPRALEGAPVAPDKLAALAGRLASRVRNAEGLRQMLALMLNIPVSVAENVPQWVQLRDRATLGSGSGFRLGVNSTIGARVFDQAGKFRISLGPLSGPEFLSLLPGGSGARQLSWLAGLYAPDHLSYDVELKLNADEALPTRLGARESRLGLTTYVGKPGAGVVSRIVTYA